MKYIIWGAGHRGKVLYDILGKEKIAGFIDSNPQKLGTDYLGFLIIDYDTYLKKYKKYPVIISMVFGGNVRNIMDQDNTLYFSVEDCPPEFMGYGLIKAKSYMDNYQFDINIHSTIVLYGCTLYTMLVYEKLKSIGCMSVKIMPSDYVDAAKIMQLQSYYKDITFTSSEHPTADTLFITDKHYYDESPEIEAASIIDIVDWTPKISEYENKKIRKVKNNIHAKRCFIIATGPSLTLDDLNTLNKNNEFCIGMNSVYKCFSETKWRPDCYVLLDAGGIKDWYRDFYKLSDVPYKFIADSQPYFDYSSLDQNWYIYHAILDNHSLHNMSISDDFSKKVYNGSTVTYVCLQLAMYLGIKEIYLLGVDFSYNAGKQNHFVKQIEPDDIYDGMTEQNKGLELSYLAYKKAKEYAQANGITIYNATRGGCLELFQRVDFDRLFHEQPENEK